MSEPWKQYQTAGTPKPWEEYGRVPGGGSTGPSPNGPKTGLSRPAGAGPAPAPDLAEGMPFWEKALVGAGGGMRNAYLGAKNLVGMGTEEEADERKEWARIKEDLGGWGTAGEILGEGALTAPLGGPVAAGAKVLTKAVPMLGRIGAQGGRVANLGTAGKAGAEGALAAGVVGDAEDKGIGDRLDNVIAGGTVGAIAPAALGAVGSAGRKVATELMPTQAAASKRGYNALERTLGPERLDQVINSVENPNPSSLPRTTAAMAQDPRMGALERGARNRGNVPFDAHDRAVAEEAWKLTQGATKNAEDIPGLQKGANDIMAQGKEVLDKLPLSQARRTDLSKELLDLRNSNEVIANPALAREIDTALQAIDHPDATLGVLPQLYWSLGKEAGDSTAIQKVRGVIRDVADERSGGQFTNMQAGYGATQDQLAGATSAKNVRDTFMREDNVPRTSRYYGESGRAGALPALESTPLRKAISTAGKGGGMAELPPSQVTELNRVADQLREHEIYKPSQSAGAPGVGLGEAEGVASAALNAGPLWRLRGALGSTFAGLNEASQKQVDQALLDPQAFLKMVEAKRALSRPLEAWEKALESTLRGASRSAAISTGDN